MLRVALQGGKENRTDTAGISDGPKTLLAPHTTSFRQHSVVCLHEFAKTIYIEPLFSGNVKKIHFSAGPTHLRQRSRS